MMWRDHKFTTKGGFSALVRKIVMIENFVTDAKTAQNKNG